MWKETKKRGSSWQRFSSAHKGLVVVIWADGVRHKHSSSVCNSYPEMHSLVQKQCIACLSHCPRLSAEHCGVCSPRLVNGATCGLGAESGVSVLRQKSCVVPVLESTGAKKLQRKVCAQRHRAYRPLLFLRAWWKMHRLSAGFTFSVIKITWIYLSLVAGVVDCFPARFPCQPMTVRAS